jgi:hypothetical protein
MRRSRLPALSVALLLAFPGLCEAVCGNSAGFAIHHCGDRAWFEPPPEGSGAVRAVFWQIGFGNAAISNGRGSNGLGVAPAGTFNGNDSGLAELPLLSASRLLADARVPEGSLCLGPANWGSRGVDGCCDNRRDPASIRNDGFLNPYFDAGLFRSEGRFVRSLRRVEDYPMAVLLTEEMGLYFAVAAVAVASRGGDPEDLRPGNFTFADVRNGKPNPVTGARNVIPWQEAPRVRLEVLGPAAGAEERSPRAWNVRASWEPVLLYSDDSRIPSEAHAIDNPGKGVGVADMEPLVRYRVEKSPIPEALVDDEGYPAPDLLLWETAAETEEGSALIELEEDACVRVAVRLGRAPRTRSVSAGECSLGRCGDIGYAVPGPPACLEGPLLRGAARRGGDR